MRRYFVPIGKSVLILALLSLVSCDSSNSSSSSSGRADEPVAVLTVRESRIVPGRLEFSGSESQPSEGSELLSHHYKITELQSGEIVYESLHTDSLGIVQLKVFPTVETAGAVILDSDYLVELEVTDDQGKTHRARTTVPVQARLVFIDAGEAVIPEEARSGSLLPATTFDSSSCTTTCGSPYIADADDYEGSLSCVPDNASGCYTFDLATLVTFINDYVYENYGYYTTSTVVLQAFGGEGGDGANRTFLTWTGDGGDGGGGGFAQMITTVDDLEDVYGTTTIYYYLGGNGESAGSASWYTGGAGGASTIMSVAEADSTDSLTINDDDSSDSTVLLIAGGGGGGGSFDIEFLIPVDGHDGGAGGVAISSFDSSTASGSDGSTSHGGAGGSSSGGKDIGGDGGGGYFSSTTVFDGYPGWINETPTLDGGSGESSTDGYGSGGGGYGGGEVGSEYSSKFYGGGGGGSYAAGSTTSDDTGTAATSEDYELGTGDGEVVIGIIISATGD